jgi:hypothetical protein
VPKKMGKFKKTFMKKGPSNKRQAKALVVNQEEYSSDDSDEDEETSEVAAIATTFIPSSSLLESPNENLPNNHIAKCLMAKTSEVSPSQPKSKSKHSMSVDLESLKIKEEVVGLDMFVTNMQGETRMHFESLMRQLGEANNLIELKEGFERENADEISTLSCALEEEQALRISLEESILLLMNLII